MPNRSAQKQIALRIRSARQAARLTQTELAARLGLSRSAAVSYTHLDVYKRQVKWCIEVAVRTA